MAVHFEFDSAARREIESIAAAVPPLLADVVDRPLPRGTVNVVLCSSHLIARLNKQFRGREDVTDVLSFPLGADCGETAGEIYICWPRLLEQAAEYGHSRQREFGFLLVHGLLHLAGYEHGAEPCPRMRRMEEQVLNRLNLRR